MLLKKKKRYKIKATTFDAKGKKLAEAYNDYEKTHPLQKYFSEKAGESEHKSCLHAELASILKSRGKRIFSILIERYDDSGNPKLAMPCLSCQEAIKAFGVQQVMYTTNGENYGEYQLD